MSLQLTYFETYMAQAAERGELCDFTQPQFKEVNRIEVSGEAIRALMLGLPVKFAGETEDRTVSIKATGVRLRKPDTEVELKVLQATITGSLDLDHARSPDGAALPPLSLLACDFEEPIQLSHAHLRGLSLAGSQFSHLCAAHANIEGSVDLSGVRGRGDSAGGMCWVDFEGANISGLFSAPSAQLVAPPGRSKLELAIEPKRNALNLAHTRVDSIHLSHGFSAIGGISFALAQVEGNVRLDGSKLIAVEGRAIYAPNLVVRGNFYLRTCRDASGETIPFEVKGGVVLYYCKVGGRLAIEGGTISGTLSLYGADIKGHARLSAVETRSSPDSKIIPLKIEEDASLGGLRLAGSLVIGGVEVTRALNLSNAQISDFLFIGAFHGIEQEDRCDTLITKIGRIYLTSANIGGNLDMQGVEVATNVTAETLHVDGVARFGVSNGYRSSERHTYRLNVGGDVWLGASRFGSQCSFLGARILGSFRAPNIVTGGSFRLSTSEGFADGEEVVFPFEARLINLMGATVGNDLNLFGAKLNEDLSAKSISVTSDVYISDSWHDSRDTVLRFNARNVSLGGARIGGSLNANGALISGELRADNAEIGGTVHANCSIRKGKFHSFEAKSVSLWGVKIARNLEFIGAMIEEDIMGTSSTVGGNIYACPRTEGKVTIPFSARSLKFWSLHVDGSVFGNGAAVTDTFSLINSSVGGGVTLLRHVVSKQKKLPFKAKIMNLTGTTIGADVEIKHGLVRHRKLRNVQITGTLHGGGLKAWLTWGRRLQYLTAVSRSFAIILAACLLGWIGVGIADNRLPQATYSRLTWLPVESVLALDTGSVQTREQAGGSKKKYLLAANEKPCGDQIDPLIYAVDMFIPLLDLRQESRCVVSAAPEASPWRLSAFFYTLLGWGLMSWMLLDLARIATSGTDAASRR